MLNTPMTPGARKEQFRARLAILILLSFVALAIPPVAAYELPQQNGLNLTVTDKQRPSLYDSEHPGTYFFNIGNNMYNGGQNAIHISTTYLTAAGDITTHTENSGTFYITDTGGKGYEDGAILLIAVQENALSPQFSIDLHAEGYNFSDHAKDRGPILEEIGNYNSNAYTATLTADNFLQYDGQTVLQSWKPSTGSDGNVNMKLFNNQDLDGPKYNLILVDLNTSIVGRNNANQTQLTNYGNPKVTYTIHGYSGGNVSFVPYSWVFYQTGGGGYFDRTIGWTDRSSGDSWLVMLPEATAPVASFTSDVTSGTAPLTVTFTDTSTNTPTSWLWDFGDSSTENATEQNPVHTFVSAGTYSVKLTATNEAGSGKTTQTITVSTANTAPVATAQSVTADKNTAREITLAGTDSEGSTLTFAIATAPEQGTLGTISEAGVVTYTPATDYVGTDAFTFTVNDGSLTSDPATVDITINEVVVSPVAAFTSDVTSGTAPLTVTFTDTSTNSPTSWAWDFGDSSTENAAVQNPVHTFASAGTYTVKLTATNTAGSSEATQTITVNAPAVIPVASFTTSTTSGSVPLFIRFTDTSTNTPTEWAWDFGDGSSATTQNATHTYMATGTYTVTLTSTNAGGSNTATTTVTVTAATGGLADSAWPKFGGNAENTGQSLFVGSQTGAPKWSYTPVAVDGYPTGGFEHVTPLIGSDGTIYAGRVDWRFYAFNPNGTVKWIYNDGGTSITGGPILQSAAIGSDGTIFFGTALGDSKIYALNPDGTLKWKSPASIADMGAPAVGPDGTIYVGAGDLYAFNPTDGTIDWNYPVAVSAYNIPAIGPDGMIYIGSTDGNVYAINPDGTLKWSNTTGGAINGPCAIGTDGTIYVGNDLKQLYAFNSDGTEKWNITAGTYGNIRGVAIGPNGTIYVGNGKIIAINPDGTQKWTSPITSASIMSPPTVGADGTIYYGVGRSIMAVNPVDGSKKWSYSWKGGYIQGSPAIGSDGTVYIGGTGHDANRGLNAFAGVVELTADKTTGPNPLTVQFTGTSPLIVTGWHWDFGDGTTSTEQNPSHTYTADGSYTVNLSITHANGVNYLRQANYITVATQVPVANFTANVTTGPFPLAVEFTDTSENSPTSWAWDFENDGIIDATTQNATHTYTTTGTYTVNLTVTNAAGNNSSVQTDLITVSPPVIPVASFTATNRSGLGPRTVEFTDTSLRGPTAWLWDFGDGSTSTEQNPAHTYTTAGTYDVSLTATNIHGTNTNSSVDYVAILTQQALTNYHFINIYTANDEGVKYDVPNGVYASGGAYTYVPNTYWVMFRNAGGGGNPMHISSASNAWSAADITHTTNQSGSFWVTFSGGQPTMPDAVLLLAVNGTIPDDFRVHIRTSGQDFDAGSPATSNQGAPSTVTYVDGAVDQTFTKEDFIYGPQSWKPSSLADVAIFNGEDQTNPVNQFNLMFIDTRVGAVQDSTLTDNGMIKVEYEFENLSSTAVFHSYGWYMQSNHGTGIIMTNAIGGSEYMVTPPVTVVAPVAAFSANATSGTAPLTVQFTDASTNTPTAWTWDFGDGSTSTDQNPVHTYTTAGTYAVNMTATNAAGSDDEYKTAFITVTSGIVTLPDQANAPTDTDGDGLYDDMNGNGEMDFNDIILYFNNLEWIEVNEPVALFDFNGNGEIDFNDLILLFDKV